MRNTVEILGVKIDKISAEDALKKAEELVRTPGVSAIYTPNPDIVMAAYEEAVKERYRFFSFGDAMFIS